MSFRPAGRHPRNWDPAPSRFWNAPDGTRWRVWLDDPPRHLLAQGDARPLLTYVDMANPNRQVLRRAPVGAVLAELGGDVLLAILEEGRP